jgi:serine/threonine protein kinase
VGLLDSLKNLFGGKKKKGKRARKEPQLPRVDVRKRFDLMGRLGQGSMSKVWRARDRSLGRMVCVKILDKVKVGKFEARFLGLEKPPEGKVAHTLRHPSIVQTFEYGMSTEGEPFLVMELIEGVGLNFLIETRSNRLEDNRIHLLKQLAEALEYMHRVGYLHRDICPRNVMVTNENEVKLIDFGLSIPGRPEFFRPGNRTGTSNYLAPELIRRTSTDHRVDLFALGVTAYEVFTYGLPWERAESLQTLLSHMNSPGRDPRELKPTLDEPTRRFLIKAIERDPRDRFQTASQFREALLALPEQ